MHGLGNDFVVIDARSEAVEMTGPRAHAIADRQTGIGCDQLILLGPSDITDVLMRVLNADGGDVEVAGGGLMDPGQQVEQRTLAAAAAPADGREGAGSQGERAILQDPARLAGLGIVFGERL